MSEQKIRILVVDDHNLFREGLAALLNAASQTMVIGEAGNGMEAVEKTQTLEPEVVLMDIQMPDMNGIEATRRILASKPDTRIIMLTMLDDDDSLFAAMRAGARGYILKGADKAEVMHTILAAAEGQVLFGPTIAGRITNLFQYRFQAHPSAVAFPDLTEREREVLNLIAQGMNNQEIAQRLVISGKTISNHISNIFSKLQVADRAQAIIKARRAGMGE